MKTCLTLLTTALALGLVCSASATGKKKTAWKPSWAIATTTSGYYINSVGIAGDGSRVVGGTFFHSYSNTPGGTSLGTFGTYCYDRAGKLVWKDEFQGWQGVYWVDLSTDGAWAASGGWFSHTPMQGFVRAYDAHSGHTVLDYKTQARVNQVSLSSDGTWLVSAADTLVLFQRVNGTYQKVDEYTSSAPSDTMETIALSANGQTLVAGDYAGSLLVFQIASGKFGTPTTWTVPGGGYSHCVRITPSGATFASGGSSGNFYLFDTAQFLAHPQPTVTYNVSGAGSVYGVAVADDGSAFAGIVNSGSTGTVYFIQRSGSTGTLKWSFPTLHNPNSAWINSGANLLAVADGHPDGTPGSFYLLNATTGTEIGQYTTGNMSWPIMIAAHGSAVVGGSDDSKIYYFRLRAHR